LDIPVLGHEQEGVYRKDQELEKGDNYLMDEA
jgi:hypothetical protein